MDQPSPFTKNCPHCGKEVKAKADVCRYCHGDVTPEAIATAAATGSEASPTKRVQLTSDQRKMILARALQTQVRPNMRIESLSDFQAVLVFTMPKDTLLAGLFTLGLLFFLKKQNTRRMITVNEFGDVISTDY